MAAVVPIEVPAIARVNGMIATTRMMNGTERVVVSQMHRSPGVFFDHDRGKTHSSGKLLFSARVIPYRGSWLDFEFDPKDALFTRIDRRRKLPVSVLLRALGYSNEEMLNEFFDINTFHIEAEGVELELVPERLRGETLDFDLADGDNVIVEAGKRITARHVKQLEAAGVSALAVPDSYIVGRILSHDVIDPKTGELLATANDEINEDILEALRKAGIASVGTLWVNDLDRGPYLSNTLRIDGTKTQLEMAALSNATGIPVDVGGMHVDSVTEVAVGRLSALGVWSPPVVERHAGTGRVGDGGLDRVRLQPGVEVLHDMKKSCGDVAVVTRVQELAQVCYLLPQHGGQQD